MARLKNLYPKSTICITKMSSQRFVKDLRYKNNYDSNNTKLIPLLKPRRVKTFTDSQVS